MRIKTQWQWSMHISITKNIYHKTLKYSSGPYVWLESNLVLSEMCQCSNDSKSKQTTVLVCSTLCFSAWIEQITQHHYWFKMSVQCIAYWIWWWCLYRDKQYSRQKTDNVLVEDLGGSCTGLCYSRWQMVLLSLQQSWVMIM